MPHIIIIKVFIIISILTVFASCKDHKGNSIEREKLFSLSIGRQENQVSVFNSSGDVVYVNNQIYMRDNMVYIADGNSLKLMKFTPFGDLIFLIYNKILNLNPLLVKEMATSDDLSSRGARSFDFLSVKNVVQDSQDTLLVEDTLEKSQFKDEDGIMQKTVIRRFSKNGSYLGYIGQDGVGTKPFGIIGERLYIKNDDSLFLYTMEGEKYNIFNYTRAGEMTYKNTIELSQIPILKEYEGDSVFLSVMSIYPDMQDNAFYIYVSYYKKDYDSEKRFKGIKTLPNYIYKYNQDKREFDGIFKVDYKDIDGNKVLYQFIGIDEDDNSFFLSKTDNSLMLLVLNSKGENILIEDITADRQENSVYQEIRASRKGIVYGFFTYDDRFDIYWWRTDKLIH